MKKWARRLFYLPLLIKLHMDHSVLLEKFKEQQKRLYLTIDLGAPAHLMDFEKKKTEELAEELYKLDLRMVKLWNPQ
ncbi:hypothetical protein hairong_107 [Pseudomonas phage hairong]|nr:hypothetical protein hairong_107 [Pseudomonas phage hairong]